MTRSIVAGALLVWTVAKTRIPKLASWSASFMVSLFRSSPIKITFGSSRPALRIAVAKLETSGPTSRCVTWAIFGWCTNSTGSSTVRMWQARVSLMWLIIAASVVDLPEPVGPVTSTRPERRSAIFFTASGVPRSAKVSTFVGIVRNTAARPVSLVK